MRFAQKTVVVTGAARGIGRVVAAAFVREGARVLAADINPGEPIPGRPCCGRRAPVQSSTSPRPGH